MIYLEPHNYAGCSDEVWDECYDGTVSSYYSKGAHMDYDIIMPLVKQAEDEKWRESKLEKVKEYILRQLELPEPINYKYTGKRGCK